MVSAQIHAEQGVGLVVGRHPVVLAGQLVALAAGAPQVAVAGLVVPAVKSVELGKHLQPFVYSLTLLALFSHI